tara:strand:+ start:96 stop:260 length:165 start_codon:yes stop_codon:yes gene_type:complete
MSKFKSPNDCADCEWLADETDGEITLCNECEDELEIVLNNFSLEELIERNMKDD